MSTSTQRLTLDLEQNEDLAKLVAHLEPGDELNATLSIVAKDDKTLTVDLEEVSEGSGENADEPDDTAESEPSEDDSPAMQMMRGKS